MSQSVDQLFIDMFEREVHHAYQREGARLELLVRHGGQGEGRRVWFPRIQKTRRINKARHGQLPVHDRKEDGVWCNIEDDYLPVDMIDKLDQLKTNVALRQNYSRDHAWALGRMSDQRVINAIASSTNTTPTAGVLTLEKVSEAFVYYGDMGVPVDGRRYAAVSSKAWSDLMAIPQFSNADYVPANELPFRGSADTAKRWWTFLWFVQEGGVDADGNPDDGALPKTGNIRSSLTWHERSIGYHRQAGPATTIDWENTYQAWSIASSAACGSVLIDNAGTYILAHDESVTP